MSSEEPFAIEFTIDVAPSIPSPTEAETSCLDRLAQRSTDGDGTRVGSSRFRAPPRTFRVLIGVDRREPQVFVAEAGPFGDRWNRVGDTTAPMGAWQVVALALGAYHDWWMTVRCKHPGAPNWDRVNGIEIVKLGLIERP